jgi:cytochrome c biogenesis protein ResB
MLENDNASQAEVKKEVNSQIHKHLSTIFVVVGIISFTLGAVVNYYTIRRLNGGKA